MLLAACSLVLAQTPDAAYEPLASAYKSLSEKDYQAAVESFRKAIQTAPERASIRKDLAYTYLKIGENGLARGQFREAMRLAPDDAGVAMEYGFLCYEGKEKTDKAEARRIFDRLRKTGNAVAEQAFRNIDGPLAEGIARWQEAMRKGADDFGSHFELATLAEQRDDLELAAEHYRRAWEVRPARRATLVDLGRVWKAMNRPEQATAALLAASRATDARTAEAARELLPSRYPYVSEFRAALELDVRNVELRRELAYLLLEMGREGEAEKEFRMLAETPFRDVLAAAQLGMVLYGRGEREAAKILLDRVLAGPDQELANRVRAVLRMPQNGHLPAEAVKEASPKEMAELSIKAGYIEDALRYLKLAYEASPADDEVVLKLGWACNVLHRDAEAFRWFGMARQSADPKIAAAADRAWRNLRPTQARIRVSGWFFPLVSTRWQDLFGYAQIKAEIHSGFALQPYLSIRLDGDVRSNAPPLLYSETSLILAVGVRTPSWHGLSGWLEVGNGANYLNGHMLPDYRGGSEWNPVRGPAAGRGIGGRVWGSDGGWGVRKPVRQRLSGVHAVAGGVFAGTEIAAEPGVLGRQPDVRQQTAGVGELRGNGTGRARASVFPAAVDVRCIQCVAGWVPGQRQHAAAAAIQRFPGRSVVCVCALGRQFCWRRVGRRQRTCRTTA
jgi:Tfp pilus assembly protein PilF